MGENDFVTEGQCDKKLEKVYERINHLDRNLARIFGGVAVVVFLSAFFVTGVSFFIDFRFSSVEKSIEKMDNRIIDYIDEAK